PRSRAACRHNRLAMTASLVCLRVARGAVIATRGVAAGTCPGLVGTGAPGPRPAGKALPVGVIVDPREALDVADEFPRGPLRQHRTPGRHTFGTSMHDGEIDLCGLASVDPLIVAERRAHAAAAHGGVASAAVEGGIMLFACGDGPRVALVRIRDSRIEPCRTREELGRGYVRGASTNARQASLRTFGG